MPRIALFGGIVLIEVGTECEVQGEDEPESGCAATAAFGVVVSLHVISFSYSLQVLYQKDAQETKNEK